MCYFTLLYLSLYKVAFASQTFTLYKINLAYITTSVDKIIIIRNVGKRRTCFNTLNLLIQIINVIVIYRRKSRRVTIT